MRSRRLRFALAAAAALGVAAPWLASCSAQFDPPSRVDGLRVLAVTVDQPYAQPGDTVHFHMTWDGGGAFAGTTPQILWLGGCFDPADDTYYGCYQQFADLLASAQGGQPVDTQYLALGPGLDHFDLTLPDTIISDHPAPATGSRYGLAYVFFAVCAGTLGPAPANDAGGPAGNFPLACFDAQGNRIGADGFVPGFTQVYAFADGRTNANPTARGLRMKLGVDADVEYKPVASTPEDATAVQACGLSEDARRKLGCGSQPFSTCPAYAVDLDVGANVSELDPGSRENGKFLHEAVWIDWYTDGGDFDSDVSLVYDPHQGLNADHSVQWIAPPEKGTYSIWAVLHDARGGGSVYRGYVDVQ
ncbi:MAG TPA: hypothetical protein VHB21_24210 [Minicystis sp.]|nr:hypothetical protein [Minicystis sp.]